MVSRAAWLAAALGGACATPPEPLLAGAGASGFVRLEVVAGDREVWTIELDGSGEGAGVDHFFYGSLPTGWRQLEPAAGEPPRPFEPGEAVTTVTETGDRRFVHYGLARGAGTFKILHSEMFSRPAPAAEGG